MKAIQLETERKIVAMTWQDDRNDEDPDTQTVYKIKSSCHVMATIFRSVSSWIAFTDAASTSQFLSACPVFLQYLHILFLAFSLICLLRCSFVIFARTASAILVGLAGFS